MILHSFWLMILNNFSVSLNEKKWDHSRDVCTVSLFQVSFLYNNYCWNNPVKASGTSLISMALS